VSLYGSVVGAHFHPFRRLRLGLAVLALAAVALKVLIPSGFMVAQTRGSFPLVICTGHGPLNLSGRPDPIHGKKSTSDAPCAFSGHVATTPPTSFVVSAAVGPAYLAPAIDRRGDLAPGRGLAAPPPPSQGPPRSV
jgi:hypothetical protein